MKWTDYREALGLGFNDDQKNEAFINRMALLFDFLKNNTPYFFKPICLHYFKTVCEYPYNGYEFSSVEYSIKKETTLTGIISKSIAFVQAWNTSLSGESDCLVEPFLYDTLDYLKIPYEIIEDEDGKFVFPKGAKELDEVNVNIPFEWLKDYPKARAAMCVALKAYSESTDYSNTADLFRKALETFSQEFFNKSCSLENLKSEYGKYMQQKGVPAELSGNFETTLQMYTNYMNNYAKHQNRTEKKFLEFIMYQTGNIIRFVITLSKTN